MKDIKSREDLVKVLDELKHRLKTAPRTDELVAAFLFILENYLRAHELDQDQHLFASLPPHLRKKRVKEGVVGAGTEGYICARHPNGTHYTLGSALRWYHESELEEA